jgi:hypothetical protein
MVTPIEKIGSQPAEGRSVEDRSPIARLGAELLLRSEESQAEMQSAWKKLLGEWNIHGTPFGVQQLRELMQRESGTVSKNNDFSRELIARRQDEKE